MKITETVAGYPVTDFKKLETPTKRGWPLKPLIYVGTVHVPDLGDTKVEWNEDGKCANYIRNDCFIDTTDR